MPVLYQGPFDLDVITKLRDGKTTMGGNHIREGVVISTLPFSLNNTDRKIAKMISPDYLLRKNGSEFN